MPNLAEPQSDLSKPVFTLNTIFSPPMPFGKTETCDSAILTVYMMEGTRYFVGQPFYQLKATAEYLKDGVTIYRHEFAPGFIRTNYYKHRLGVLAKNFMRGLWYVLEHSHYRAPNSIEGEKGE